MKGGPLSFQSIVYLALVILAGCALFEEQEVIYLKKAMTLHATQADIKHELGKPRSIEPLPNGETLWRYKIRKNTGGDLNGPGDTYCKRYLPSARDHNPTDSSANHTGFRCAKSAK